VITRRVEAVENKYNKWDGLDANGEKFEKKLAHEFWGGGGEMPGSDP
jgi:hypothetical protein